jgi:hypothetical protein
MTLSVTNPPAMASEFIERLDGAIHSESQLQFDATPAILKKLDALVRYGDQGRAKSEGSNE